MKRAKQISKVIVLLFATLIITSHSALALTDLSQDELINKGFNAYEKNPCSTTTTSDTFTTANGKNNIQKAYNYFVDQGLTAAQAAGILGNLRQESGPNVNESSHNTAARPSSVSPGSIIPGETWFGGGIAQWEDSNGVPGRWTGKNGFLSFVAGKGDFAGKPQGDGKTWKDINIQLNYIWWELNHTEKGALAAVRTATTVKDATEKFERGYERAGKPVFEQRITYANEVYGWATAANAVAEAGTPPVPEHHRAAVRV